jgi:hypothetical protein
MSIFFQMPDQGNSRFARPSQDSGMNRNVVMATDGPPKKPSRVYLYECAFVISCDEFIVMPVRTYNARRGFCLK